MSQKLTMNFKRGDGLTHYFQVPEDSFVAGAKLFFAAKPQPDDDVTDAAAVIDKEFGDGDIVSPGHEQYLEGFVTYELTFEPGDITGVSFGDGSSKRKFKGEFQYVPDTGIPTSSPDDDNFIDVVIFADIKRGT